MPTIQEEDPQCEEEETNQPCSPPTTSALVAASITTPPPSISKDFPISSPPTMDISIHLTFALLAAPVIMLYSSSSITSPIFSSSSLPPPLPTFSTLSPTISTTTMEPLTLSHAFMAYVRLELSEVTLEPKVQVLLAQLVSALPIPPPPTEPPKMEPTMKISEEMERLQRVSLMSPRILIRMITLRI